MEAWELRKALEGARDNDEITVQLGDGFEIISTEVNGVVPEYGKGVALAVDVWLTEYGDDISLIASKPVLSFRRLQSEQRAWVEYNFPGRQSFQPLLGAVEEAGELAEVTDDPRLLELSKTLGRMCHSHLKRVQNIRGSEAEHHEKAKDAIADIIIFLTDYCSACDYDLQELMETTWAEVKQRDWKKDPLKGGSTSVPIQDAVNV